MGIRDGVCAPAAPAAMTPAPANRKSRFLMSIIPSPNKKTAAPGSMPPFPCKPCRPVLVARRVEVMQDRGARIERYAGGPRRARVIARTVPAALGGGHHVTRIA